MLTRNSQSHHQITRMRPPEETVSFPGCKQGRHRDLIDTHSLSNPPALNVLTWGERMTFGNGTTGYGKFIPVCEIKFQGHRQGRDAGCCAGASFKDRGSTSKTSSRPPHYLHVKTGLRVHVIKQLLVIPVLQIPLCVLTEPEIVSQRSKKNFSTEKFGLFPVLIQQHLSPVKEKGKP